jgi:hypothetical protein
VADAAVTETALRQSPELRQPTERLVIGLDQAQQAAHPSPNMEVDLEFVAPWTPEPLIPAHFDRPTSIEGWKNYFKTIASK